MANFTMIECDGCAKTVNPAKESAKGWMIVVIHLSFGKDDIAEMVPLDFCSLNCMKEKISIGTLSPVKKE